MYPTYTATEFVPIPIPYPGCDPNDPFCNGYPPPGYYPPQIVTAYPGCDPSNPSCNGYPPPGYYPPQTVTAYTPAPQTVVVTQPAPQTVMLTQPAPQTVVVTQPQSPDYAIIAIVIIAAAAVGMLLMSRRPGSATVAQLGQVTSSTQVRSAAQPGLQFCTTCGRQTILNSRFCGHCGSAQ